MNLSLVYSLAVHFLIFLAMFALMQNTPAKKVKAVYTIDFIGNASQPLRYGEPEQPAVKAPEPEPAPVPAESLPENKAEIPAPVQAPEPAPSEIKQPEPKKTAKKEYNSKAQIAEKPKKETAKKKKEEAKPAQPAAPAKTAEAAETEKKVTLAKPSILGEVESANIDPSSLHNLSTGGSGDGGPKTVRASFTNFPYPWYITQVRNSLWTQWQKRMPKKAVGLSALVSFNIDKYGAVYSVQIEQSSGNESYDYAATSAAENSAPFPPLPKDFPKDLLTVTVEFKNEE